MGAEDDIERALVSDEREAAGNFAVLGDPRLAETLLSLPRKLPRPGPVPPSPV